MIINNLDDLFNSLEFNNNKNNINSIKNYVGDDWKKIIEYIKNRDNNRDKNDEENKENNYIISENDNYKKILINSNKNFDMYLIIWNSKSKSKIHDHPKSCIMKILIGELTEEVYLNIKIRNQDKSFTNKALYLHTNKLNENNVIKRSNTKILHKIINNSIEQCISLHIYSEPNFISNSYELF